MCLIRIENFTTKSDNSSIVHVSCVYYRQMQNISNSTLRSLPCLSAIATLRSESKNLGFTLFTIAWSLALAWVVSFAFYQGARALGY
jgi:Fe2+ transport system protein B